MTAVLVAAGGGAGAVLRYWLGSAVQAGAPAGAFPLGTFVVNVSGCFAIGILAELAERRGLSADARAFLMVGVLGGFTTFSAFANDSVNALRAGAAAVAALNVVSSVALCLTATWAGRALASTLLR